VPPAVPKGPPSEARATRIAKLDLVIQGGPSTDLPGSDLAA
jgi:hypothetical protein